MDHIGYKNGLLHVEDMPLPVLAEKFGTPLYCYSAEQIIRNYRAYEQALLRVMRRESFTICYACKANSNQAILRLLQRQGAGADIVSGGELARALAAGITPEKIVFSGVGKTAEELAAAIRLGLLQINVESEDELALIAKIAQQQKKTVNIAIRVNPDVDAKTHAKITTGKKDNKFGINIQKAATLYRKAARMKGIAATGVAVHIGSQLTSLAPFKKAYRRVADLVLQLRAEGHTISRVDLGGGIGISYRDETPPDLNLYALLIRDIILPLDVHVILEPGRSIVGNAGILLSRVIRIKDSGKKKFLIIDAAMNDLLRPALYDAYHQTLPARQTGGRKTRYDIVGPVCESGDTFLAGEPLQQMQQGDIVALMNSGAYGTVMASSYNTRPLAAEVLIHGKKADIIRSRRGIQDLIADDNIPAWLQKS